MLSANPTFFEKALLHFRGNLFIPDARKYWKKNVVKTIEAYLKKNPEIDTLITTGPPHSVHLIGRALKNKTPLRWIADFRDPWTTISYHQYLRLSKSSRQKHKKLEEQVLNSCDDLIVTSPKTKANFEKLTDKPIHLITNGYDFDNPKLKPNPEVFKMSYVGSLLRDRNPLLLWEVLSDLINKNKDFELVLNFIFMENKQITSKKSYHITNWIQMFTFMDIFRMRRLLKSCRAVKYYYLLKLIVNKRARLFLESYLNT